MCTLKVDMGNAVAPTNCVSKVPVSVVFLRDGVPLYVYYLSVDIQSGY